MNRSTLITQLPLANQPANRTIHIELSYRQGGYEYGRTTQRGYYLSAQVKKVEKEDGFTFTSFSPMSGICQCIEPASRYSEKRLESLATEIKADPFRYAHLVEHTLANENLELAPKQG
jgi:hypothetical protein